MKRLQQWGPTVIRLVLGLIFIVHGWGKMHGLWNKIIHGQSWGFVNYVTFMPILPAIVWASMAAIAEFFGGILVFVGFWTRLGSFGISIVMVVALLGIHVPKGMEANVGMVDEIEFPLALLAMAISLLLTGPGRYSIKLKK